MLHKWFTWKTETSFLFLQWNLNSIPGLTFALTTTVLLAILFEVLSYYIQLLQIHHGRESFLRNFPKNLVIASIYMLRLLCGYFLMMSVMTFNLWILVSVVIGGGIGYLCGRPIISSYFFRSQDQYNISTGIIRTQPKTSDDYLPLGLYFNTSDPYVSATTTTDGKEQTTTTNKELTMYISVL